MSAEPTTTFLVHDWAGLHAALDAIAGGDGRYAITLDIPAGTAIRFEPGDSREVQLVPFTGERQVFGFNGLVNGPLD